MRADHTTQTRQLRSGFTLIELLVVIAIIAILAALTLGIINGVMNTQMTKATTQTLEKLHSQLLRQWKATTDQAKEDWRNGKYDPTVYNVLMASAGNKPDQARNLYVQMRLQQEFPTNFTEALNPVVYTSAAGTCSLPPLTYYQTKLQGVPAMTSPPTWQSSVCLYLALLRSRRGEVSPIEESVGQNALQDMNGAKVIVDAWGTPISYTRGSGNTNPAVLSAGPNRNPGDSDDISSLTTRTNTARGD
jgi:prepilin-type N-terminal cleavage/methylation domain-containing protein